MIRLYFSRIRGIYRTSPLQNIHALHRLHLLYLFSLVRCNALLGYYQVYYCIKSNCYLNPSALHLNMLIKLNRYHLLYLLHLLMLLIDIYPKADKIPIMLTKTNTALWHHTFQNRRRPG